MQSPHTFKSLRFEAKALWLIVMLGAVSALVLALAATSMSSLSSILTLVSAAAIAALVCQFHPTIPRTNIRISAKAIFTFWGIIWLGPAAGIVLSAVASIAGRSSSDRGLTAKLYGMFCDISAAYTSAIAYFVTFAFVNTYLIDSRSHQFPVPTAVLIAVIVMAVTNFVVRGILAFLGRAADESCQFWENLFKSFVRPAGNYIACLLATLIIYAVFRHFGIELGLVLLPIAVFGSIANRIHRRMLEQKVKEISEASRLHLATVEALASAIDARDQAGAGHIRRTQIFAVGLGNVLSLPKEDVDALEAASLLHDIGKLAIPDHILNKPTRLTQAELEKTKIHVSVGASILEKAGFGHSVVSAVRHHHEWFNGCGYPEGLRGKNIPLTARVLSIADVYDTLRGPKPYRSPMSQEDSCSLLRERAGRQFDPKLINVFLENVDVFEADVVAQGLAYETAEEILEDPHLSLGGRRRLSYMDEIKRANREVVSLYEIARDLSSSEGLERTLALFTRQISEFVPYDNCIVYLVEESGDYATAVHADGKNHTELKGKRLKIGEGATGYVLDKQKPIDHVDPALDFAFSEYEFTSKYVGMASLPLITEGRLLGAVSLYSNELPNYEEEHLRLLETISRIAADAIGRSQAHDQTKSFALTDPLTGLPNARSLQQQFDKETARAGRNNSNFQLLMLDLDGFKIVNDTYGHRSGDTMLREVADVVRGQLRDYDFLARYGGDEFVALIPDTDFEYVKDLCRRIEKAVSSFRMTFGEEEHASVGISLGSASFPKDGEQMHDLIAVADKAMYRVKASRKTVRKLVVLPIDHEIAKTGSLSGVHEDILETATHY